MTRFSLTIIFGSFEWEHINHFYKPFSALKAARAQSRIFARFDLIYVRYASQHSNRALLILYRNVDKRKCVSIIQFGITFQLSVEIE